MPFCAVSGRDQAVPVPACRPVKATMNARDYPTAMRRVVVRDDTGKRLFLLTNNFTLKPELIADLDRHCQKTFVS